VLFDAGWQQVGVLFDRHGSGGLAGGQLGCNYQTGMLVVGIEGEAFWSGIGNTVDLFNGNNWWSTTHVRNKADFDVAGRFGVAFDRALVYGKAGWVWGRFSWDYVDRFNHSENASATLDGLLVGLGLEYAIATNWTAKFEYDYLGFNARNVLVTTSLPSTNTQNVSADKHIFKLGLNYQFDAGRAPVTRAASASAAAPTYNWNGCYVGVHAGGGVLFDAGWQQIVAVADRHGGGALAGGQLGCNYQTGMLVVGIEGEGSWSGIGNTVDRFNGNIWWSTAHVKNKADFDVAGRFGVAFARALVYGKAGWAWGRFSWDYVNRFQFSENASATLDGLLIGLGLEYGITTNWTAKFEYDYLGFDARNVLVTTSVPSTNTQNVSADKHVFKVGLNYKFGMGN
jgi:outer membrane immunogenic protein